MMTMIFSGRFYTYKYGDAPVKTIYKDLTDDIPSLKQMIRFAYVRVGNSFLLSVKEMTLDTSTCT